MNRRLAAPAALAATLLIPGSTRAACNPANLVCPGHGGIVDAGPLAPFILDAVLAHGMPAVPLSAGLNFVKVSPAYFSYSRSLSANSFSESDTGGGASVAYLHGFSSHWGVSAVVGYAKTTGNLSATPDSNNNTLTGSGSNWDKAVGGSVSLVFDPTSGAGSFRLPISLGAGYMSLSGDRGPVSGTYFSGSASGHQGQIEETYDSSQPALYAGIAPQWTVGSVRLTPFAFLSAGLKKTAVTFIARDLTTSQSGQFSYDAANNAVAGAGIDVLFLPMNLSLSYIPVVPGSKGSLSTYTATWSHAWGGS